MTCGIVGVVCMWFTVRSKSSCSCGVAREKGLLGSHLNNCLLTLCLFPNKLVSFEFETHYVNEIVITHFIDIFDEKKSSLLNFPIILGYVKNVVQFTHFQKFCFNFIGKTNGLLFIIRHVVIRDSGTLLTPFIFIIC